MNNMNSETVKQMAATGAALQLLLSGDREIRDFHILLGTSMPDSEIVRIGYAAKEGRSTLGVTFKCHGSEALVENLFFFKPFVKQQLMSMSVCSFVQSEDGKFALRVARREQPTEHIFSRSSNRLVSRPVKDDTGRAMAELRGLQALLAKAATPECQKAYSLVQ